MPTAQLRPLLARDGIFNARDLGGLPTVDGATTASGRLVRADALHRSRWSLDGLRSYGVRRVLDLRDERERDESGALEADGVVVEHHPVLDPTFSWNDEAHEQPETLLAHRYRVILSEFAPRFASALAAIAEELSAPEGGAVAYHCAVGKDRTGLLTMVLLSLLEVPDEVIAADYARSSAATAVQVGWLWSFGLPGGDASDAELDHGVWSARPETMVDTLQWLRDTHLGVEGYLDHAEVPADVRAAIRSAMRASR